MAKAGDKTSTKRIWYSQGWALVAQAYGNLAEEVLKEALAEGRVPSWDNSGPITPEFWRLDLIIATAKNSARERTYRVVFAGPGTGPFTKNSNPPCEHHGITLGHA